MKYWALAIATAAGLGSSIPAAAQRSIHLGVAAGGVAPIGILNNTFSSGPSGLATLSFAQQDSPLGFRLDYQYDGFKGKAINGATVSDMHVNSATANLVVPFRVGYVKPYFIAGFGLYPLRLPGATKRENDWGYNGGGGIGFPIPGTTIGGFVEIRYHDVNRSNTSAYHFVPVTLGVLF